MPGTLRALAHLNCAERYDPRVGMRPRHVEVQPQAPVAQGVRDERWNFHPHLLQREVGL